MSAGDQQFRHLSTSVQPDTHLQDMHETAGNIPRLADAVTHAHMLSHMHSLHPVVPCSAAPLSIWMLHAGLTAQVCLALLLTMSAGERWHKHPSRHSESPPVLV